MKKISLIIAVVALIVSGVVYFKPEVNIENYNSYILVDKTVKDTSFGASVQPYAGFNYTLYGSGVSSSATSIVLSSLTIPQTAQKIQDADLSSTFYLTLEPGSKSRQEIVSCTTVTQNSDGTATLSGCSRGLAPIFPYTASSTLAFAHGGNVSAIFSDPPQLFSDYSARANDESISGLWTFTTSPYGSTPTSSSQLATKSYADNLAIAGAPDSTLSVKGLLEMATGFQAASSTPTDDTTAPLALTTLYATSSPYTASSWVPVTDRDGKLNQTFWRLSDAFTWTGAHSFTAATTTMVGTELSGNDLKINGVGYAFPSSQGASSTVLMNDSNGTIKWTPTYHLLAEKYWSSATPTTTLSIPAATNLRIILNLALASNNVLNVEFNNDTDNNYTYKSMDNNDAPVTKTSQSAIKLNHGGLDCSTTRCYFDISINNITGINKLFTYTGLSSNDAGAVNITQGGGAWANTSAQITTIEVGSAVNVTGYIGIYGQE